MSRNSASIGLLMLIVASLIWSTTPVLSKLVYNEGLHPLLLVEFRLLLGFLLLLSMGKDPRPRKASYKDLVKLSIFGLGGNYLVYHFSVYYTTASSAQVLEGTAPAFVLIMAFLLREEALSLRKVSGVLLVLFGTLMIFYSHFQRIFIFGDFLGVLAGITWAYFITMGSRTLKTIGPADSLVFLFGFSALILLPFTLPLTLVLNTKVAFLVILLGVFHTFAAYMLYFKGIKLTTPITAGVIFALNPILTVYLSKNILGESSGLLYYLGVFVTILGVLTVILKGSIKGPASTMA